MSTWSSNLDQFLKDNEAATQQALVAAAYVLVNSVKRALRGGFKSGAFVTGNIINSVTRSAPFREGMGWSIQVGTNVEYALPWELGHHNIFTRKYERAERWRPAFMDSQEALKAAFARQWERSMQKWRAS